MNKQYHKHLGQDQVVSLSLRVRFLRVTIRRAKAARVPDDAVLFTEKLKEKGVATAGFANNINLTATFNLNQGYDIFKYEAPDYPMGGTESVFGLTFYKVVIKVMERFPNAHREVSLTKPASQVFSDAKDFISANKERPWMVYAHLMGLMILILNIPF